MRPYLGHLVTLLVFLVLEVVSVQSTAEPLVAIGLEDLVLHIETVMLFEVVERQGREQPRDTCADDSDSELLAQSPLGFVWIARVFGWEKFPFLWVWLWWNKLIVVQSCWVISTHQDTGIPLEVPHPSPHRKGCPLRPVRELLDRDRGRPRDLGLFGHDRGYV